MAEHLKHGPEHKQHAVEASAESKSNLERLQREAEKEDSGEHSAKVESLQQSAEQEAISGAEVAIGEKQSTPDHSLHTQRELKNLAYKQTLDKVRGKLSPPERALSRVIHQPIIDKVSNIAGQSVARPSGVLGGGLAAFIGSGLLLFASRHYGFRYNFLIVVMLFVAGFALGLLAELFLRSTHRKKHAR